jgi:hypothetical protein
MRRASPDSEAAASVRQIGDRAGHEAGSRPSISGDGPASVALVAPSLRKSDSRRLVDRHPVGVTPTT